MEHSPADAEDIAESRRAYPFRTYDLRLTCKAFVRSESETIAPALAASGSTTTNVNNGSATTNWTGAVNGATTAPSVVSGAVKVTNGAAVSGVITCSLTYTARITTSSTKYLVMDWKPESTTGDPDLRAFGDGVELVKVAQNVSPTAGYTRSWFYVAASSIAVLRLDSASDIPSAWVGSNPAAVRSLYVDNIDRSDVKPTLGTARQLLRGIDVAGSTRAPGSLVVEHATSALGDVLVYVFPGTPDVLGYSPPLGQNRVSGPTITPDSSLVSGGSADLTAGTVTFDVPVRNLPPGLCTLMVRTTTGGTISPCTLTWTAKTRVNSTDLGLDPERHRQRDPVRLLGLSHLGGDADHASHRRRRRGGLHGGRAGDPGRDGARRGHLRRGLAVLRHRAARAGLVRHRHRIIGRTGQAAVHRATHHHPTAAHHPHRACRRPLGRLPSRR